MSNKIFNFTSMKLMLKFIVFILICLVTHETKAQVFIKPNNSYGLEYNRIKLDTALVTPSDTVVNKIVGSVAVLNSVFYIKNLYSWDAIALAGSGGGSGSPLTWENVLDNGSDFSHSHLSNGNTNDLYFNNYGVFTVNSDQFAVPYLSGGDVNNQWITTDGAGNFFLKSLPIAVDSSGTTFGNQDLQDVIEQGNRLRHNNTIHSVGHDFYIDSLGNYSTFSGKTATFDNQTGAYTEIHQDSANAYLYSQGYTGLNISEVRTHQDSAHFQSYDSLGHNARFTAYGKGTLNSYASIADSLNSPKIVFGDANYKNSDITQVLTTNSNGDLTFTSGGGVTGDITWSVLSILNTPPGSPVTGDTYLVGTAGTGAWSGHNNQIASWNGSSWDFGTATTGDLLQNDNNSIVYKWTGTAWVQVGKAPWLIGLNAGVTNPKFGTSNNTGLGIYTNNTQRLGIGNAGAFTFNALSGTGNALMGLSSTGLASRVTPVWDTTNVSNADAWHVPHDGVTSANANGNLMLADRTKRRKYFPAGVYILDVSALRSGSQVNKKGLEVTQDSIEIFGDPAGGTIFKAKATATGDTSTTNWYAVINALYRSNIYIHDITIDGNRANEAVYNSNPYVNPSGHNDTSKHYTINGIYFKDGGGNRVKNVSVYGCPGFGIEVYNANVNIDNAVDSLNGMAGIDYVTKSTGICTNSRCTYNNSDNIRIDNCSGGLKFDNIEVSFSGTVTTSNLFAGIWHNNSSNISFDHIYSHDNSAYGMDGGAADSTYSNISLTNSWIEYNANGGYVTGIPGTVIDNVTFKNNGKKRDGTTDTHSSYNPGAIVVNNLARLRVNNIYAFDTGVNSQTYFFKNWGGGTSTLGFYNSTVSNVHAYNIADTAHFKNGDRGTNDFSQIHLYTSSGGMIPFAADTAVKVMIKGTEKWIDKTTYFASSGGSGSTALSSLTAATATNTINSADFGQVWQWNTLSTNSALSLTSTSTAGDGSKMLQITRSGANANAAKTIYGQYTTVTNTNATSGTNIGGYFSATGATSPVVALTNNFGVQVDAPGTAATITGGIQLTNTTDATVGTTVQMPGTLEFDGTAWKSNATAAAQHHRWRFKMTPATGAASTASTFTLQVSNNNNTFADAFSVTNLGVWNFPVVSGNPTFQFGNGYTAMAGNSVTTGYGLTIGPAGTAGFLNLSGGYTSTTAMVALNVNPSLSLVNPNNASYSVGTKSIPTTNSALVYTQTPTDFIGVMGQPQYATAATSVVFTAVTGVEGSVNLASNVAVNTTTARGFHAYITGAATPTGKAVTWAGLDIDSADNNHYTTNNYGIRQKGTNATSFFAGGTLVGWNGSATPALSSTKILFQVQGDNTKGSIPAPRMTNTQRDAISSPDEGLQIYSTTDHAYEYFNGTSWNQF
jgi:hypothetical protein